MQRALGVNIGDAMAKFTELGFVVPDKVIAQYPTTWQSFGSFMNFGVSDGFHRILRSYSQHDVRPIGKTLMIFVRGSRHPQPDMQLPIDAWLLVQSMRFVAL